MRGTGEAAGRRTVRGADGLELNLLVEGDVESDPVVFLHGGGLTAHTWNRVVRELREDHLCVAMDLRGHGDSGWSPVGDYTLPTLAADLHAVVDLGGFDRPHIVGMSLGGQVALHAVCHGLPVRTLTLVDVGPRMLPRREGADRTFMQTHSYPTFDAALDAASAFQPTRDRTSLAQSLQRSMRSREDGSWSWKWDPRRRATLPERSAAAAGLWPILGEVRCPVLVVRGTRSPVFGERDAEELVAALPDARLETVDSGHNVQSERPAELVSLLRTHLT